MWAAYGIYDESQKYISRNVFISNESKQSCDETITIPASAKYIRFSYRSWDEVSNLLIESNRQSLLDSLDGEVTTIKNDLSAKLDKPSTYSVGQVFKVSSIDSEGNPVLEAVTLTEDKEWTLVGTIAGDSDDRGNIDTGVTVDFSDCTEMLISGWVTGTASSHLESNYGHIAYNVATTNTRSFMGYFRDFLLGYECVYAQYNTDKKQLYIGSPATGYTWVNGSKISGINEVHWSASSNITACEIKVYTR